MSQANPAQATDAESSQIDQAVSQGGAYEVLRKRLGEQGQRLSSVADALNAQRLQEFGDSRMEVIGRLRIRTENNCVGRDIVQVGELLLFGYNVFMGMKTQTRVEDVFGLYHLVQAAEGFDVTPVDLAGSFLGQPGFVRDFDELYAYYKNAKLLQLVVRNSKLLAAFQIGERSTDMRVFRWSISNVGELTYLDARGERDIALPEPFDFDWTRSTREMVVNGRYPHLNILDTVFIETTGGDLTIKIENNTESGQGVYSEPVEDQTQSLDDATFEFARVGSLVLIKVLPYRESVWRGLIYNTLTRKVLRNDAIVQACVQLPEDHGIIFPGGYYLQNGEHKSFDASMDGMQFRRMLRSPNGEDVMYVFYEHEAGRLALFGYNMIQRKLQNPVFGHGYARLADGRMVIFNAEGEEPTRIHPMQVWQTPFSSEEFAASQPPGTSFMGRIGNSELVRGISNLYDLSRQIHNEEVSVQRYQMLTHNTRRMFDAHHWLDDAHCGGAATLLHEISATGEAMLDEYEKVQSIRQQSARTMAEAKANHQALLKRLLPENWTGIQEFVDALNAITALRGHLLTIREYRYIDTAALDAMGAQLQTEAERIGVATGTFLAGDKALLPFAQRLQALDEQAQQAATARQLAEQIQAMQAMSADLDVLSELMAGLKVEDATERTRVVEAVSAIYARLNQSRARADQKRKTLGSSEAVAQFGAQFTLFGQSITSALGLATDPERADEQLSRLLVQLEELESQFGEHEQFLGDILSKREELLETFEGHKQALLDDRQRKAQSVLDAANRILDGLGRRTERFAGSDELNAFFAGDPLVLKLRELSERLRALKDSVKADDVDARLKGTRDQAIRALRDRSDLFEDGGNVVKLGPRHRFSVNTQALDLTLLPREDGLALHLTGTDFLEPLRSPALDELREYWQVGLESESPTLYRGEYLAGQMLQAAEHGSDGLSRERLQRDLRDVEALSRAVREFAAPRYRDGYERGIHDHDAALILQALLQLREQAGALIWPPLARALATLFWLQQGQSAPVQEWRKRFLSALRLRQVFGADQGAVELTGTLRSLIEAFVTSEQLSFDSSTIDAAAQYLAGLDLQEDAGFVYSREAAGLVDTLKQRMQAADLRGHIEQTLEALKHDLGARWSLALHWIEGLCREPALAASARLAPEAAALLLIDPMFRHTLVEAATSVTVSGLLGEHPRIQQGSMVLAVDDALARLRAHQQHFVPGFQRYQALRHETVVQQREALRLSEFMPRPLSSFVRNRLINDTHLPIIGDNLAKQMGTVGENKRSDLMGLLMLISPPGYGKTTLMEYVAHRLGLIFMKINGPALGHEVRSVDPAQAPDATSRQELEKLNLALEMGNNVMLYVDDIQHTHPEFLQKFISLCDGTRRIEGVWKGRTKTYDMRGKKFCVVMAGNPYTESGEVFKIPDMLANRADIYNLGDVLGGIQETFALSYIENCLTSNTVLAPLATRDLADLYLLVDKARGKEVSTNALSHAYSGAEINEIVATLQRLTQVRDVVFQVNQQYIASAAQADRYRTEPPFKLQGSYRNMNKLAEKISPAMNEAELQQLISDHYQGESQLLTTGAEENLLKLAELRGRMDPAQQARWAQIKRDFLRNKAMGAEDADVGGRVVAQLADIAVGLQGLRPEETDAAVATEAAVPWEEILGALQRIAVGADQGATQAALQAIPASVQATLTPLLNLFNEGQDRQEKINQAMLHLADAIRVSVGSAPAKPEPRKAARQTPEERRLNQALETMEFGKKKPE